MLIACAGSSDGRGVATDRSAYFACDVELRAVGRNVELQSKRDMREGGGGGATLGAELTEPINNNRSDGIDLGSESSRISARGAFQAFFPRAHPFYTSFTLVVKRAVV